MSDIADTALIKRLGDLDTDDMTEWEVEFIESVLEQKYWLTDRQRDKVDDLLRKYE